MLPVLLAAAVAVAASGAAPALGAAGPPLARSIERREEEYGRAHASADMLKDLEWGPGSSDPSLADDGKAWVFEPHDRTLRQPTHVFGVKYPERLTKEQKKKGGLPGGLSDQFESDADLDAAKLGAALVSAYQKVNDPAAAGTAPLLREYERMLKSDSGFARRLRDHFAELDLNHDRQVDVHEVNHAVNEGQLSYIGARVLKSWDINFSRRLSWEEFRLGPLFVAVLESHPRILQGFRLNVPGIESTVARLYRAALGTYYMTNPAASGLLEVESRTGAAGAAAELPPLRETRKAAPSELLETGAGAAAEAAASRAQAGVEAGVAAEAMSESEVQRRVLEHLGLGGQAASQMTDAEKDRLRRQGGIFDKIKSGVNTFLGNGNGMQKTDTAANEEAQSKRPKAVWGIPKTVDQECVLCQFVVQRVQEELKSAVVDDFTSFGGPGSGPYPKSAFPSGGFPGADSLAGMRGGFPSPNGMPDSARDSVGPRARLVSERGSRSPERMIMGIVTKIMRRVCGESAPYLFRDMCADIFKQRSQLAYGIFRRLSSGGTCMVANMCGQASYFYSKVGVHYAAMSSKFNGGVGLCGMIGGPKARAYEGASNTACFAQKLGKKVGVLRFQEEGVQAAAEAAARGAEEEQLEERTEELNERDPMRLSVLTKAFDERDAGQPRRRPGAEAPMQLNDA